MKFSRCFVVLTAVAMLAMFANGASANLLVNDQFESPSTAPGVEFPGGGDGWTAFGGAFTINDAVEPNQLAGSTQVLKVFGEAGVFQDFPASPGQTWNGGAFILNSSLDLAGNGQVAAVNIEWKGAGGSDLGFISNGTNADDLPVDEWVQKTITGVAPAGTEVARLTLITGPFAGPGAGAPRYDFAFFEVVPEPGTMVLAGMGLIGLFGSRRRQRA